MYSLSMLRMLKDVQVDLDFGTWARNAMKADLPAS